MLHLHLLDPSNNINILLQNHQFFLVFMQFLKMLWKHIGVLTVLTIDLGLGPDHSFD